MERSRRTKIHVPTFAKQRSPFKNIDRNEYSSSFHSPAVKEITPKFDWKCSVIENFMGNSNMDKIDDFIPCGFRRNTGKADKILIYFHGNNEDLAQAFRFVQYIQYRMEVHLLIVEYPGYGVYKGIPNEQNVLKDAHRVIEF
jgi:hypothetical protein